MTTTHMRQYCDQPQVVPPALPAGLDTDVTEAIILSASKWINGTTLTYFFKQVDAFAWPEPQKAVVRWAFAQWRALGIGIDFAEVASEADAILVIGLVQGDGSWSYIGTEVLHNRKNGCNMNYGWDLTTPWGHATALHEIGHAIGMPHEHQNPQSGIVWNEPAVIAHFSAAPNNWDEPKIRWNILRHVVPAEVAGSTWDPRSIMHYPFDPGLIQAPHPYDADGTPENIALADNDKSWAVRFYPPIAAAAAIAPGELAPVSTDQAAQTDFMFVPDETRQYRVQMVGAADAKIAILQKGDAGWLQTLGVADDSATSSNASLTKTLTAGTPYRIAVRTHYADHQVKPYVVVV